MVRIPYIKQFTDEPKIPIILRNGKKRIEFSVIVDSGAGISLIPFKIGQRVGLKPFKKDRRFSLIGVGGGSIEVIEKKVEFQIKEEVFKARVGWASIDSVPVLLGRLDVFDKYNIEFCHKKKEIIFCKSEL